MKNLFRRNLLKVTAILLVIALSVPTYIFVAAEEQVPVIMYGDVNGDDNIDASDALAVLKHAAKLQLLADTLINCADVYVDSHVDASDALTILKYAAKLINELPVTKGEEPIFSPTPEPANVHTAEITLANGTAVITIYTNPFSTFDIGVLSSFACTNVEYDSSFMAVKDSPDYTCSAVSDNSGTDGKGNEYAYITGAGCQMDGSDIPYEGPLARFTFENVEDGAEFTVIYNTAAYADDVSKSPVLVKLTAVETDVIPTESPNATPTVEPTLGPDDTPVPTIPATPTVEPTVTPTVEPTATPTPEPTPDPSLRPITYDAEADTYTMHGQHDWPVATNDATRNQSNAEYKITNPFVGYDFSEEYGLDEEGMTVWTKGATISFWVYLPEGALDAEVLTFKLGNYRQPHKDDYVKYLTCQAYSPDDESYSMGTAETYIGRAEDGTETEYTVLSGYGDNVRYNPEYPAEGLYKVKSGANLEVYKKGTDPNDDANWTAIALIGTGYYEGYSKRFDEEGGENSKIREANIKGSLNIYASGTIAWQQDDQKSIQINPTAEKYGEECAMFNPSFFYHANGISQHWAPDTIFKETSDIPPVLAKKGEWHFMVVTIMNDWVQVYQDGVKLEQNKYINMNGAWLNPSVLRKSLKEFNLGYGYRDLWNTNAPSLANSLGMLLTDYISYETTELYVGGYGVAAERAGINHIGTPDGTQIKNLQFFAEPAKDEDVKADRIENLTPIEVK